MPSKRAKRGSNAPKAPWGPRGKLLRGGPQNMGSYSTEFSMKDEAKHTVSHQASWGTGDAKLRQRPITFVSAGVVEPLKEESVSTDAADPSITKASSHDATKVDPADDEASHAVNIDAVATKTEIGTEITVERTAEATAESIIGATGQDAIVVGESTQHCHIGISERTPGPVGAEGEDFFVFDLAENDDNPVPGSFIPPPRIPSPKPSLAESDSSEEVILFKGRTAGDRSATPVNKPFRDRIVDAASPRGSSEPKAEVTTGAPRWRGSQRGGASGPYPVTRTQRQPRSRRNSKKNRKPHSYEEEDDDGTDNDAILADYIANMAADSDDDVLASPFASLGGHRDLGDDDGAVDIGDTNTKSPLDDDLSGGEQGLTASGTSEGEMDNNEDLDLDDEALAHLLAKQEDLGMGSDELMLFSGAFTSARQLRGTQSSSKRPGRGLHQLASATQVADALDNLDIADWNQLPGQRSGRKNKQPPNFNVSDSDIEAALNSAWSRDRERKKHRRMEREALRAEGMLGTKADPSDLRVKYPSGMRLDDMKAELVLFLVGSADRLDFPPLDKHARKVLHEVANKFNVKSQSTGKGDQRRPILYRTNRTVRYTSTTTVDATKHVEQATMRIHRKYFHRVDKAQGTGIPRGSMMGNAGNRAATGHKALTLREGEIVGASVPELSQENKGRTMLEKMGWSKGMSLGALDNQGILEPVTQVIKRSKAGLG
ncbi:hypothetical protein B0J18DRAFT_404434 [Chaetomium sp. MPI-SDFR-AT-0129]|nr:hypothetical protein B0J18DRAFT_404434 [Chaetomium sp. MPI-SDFR-AT-0129]